VPDPFSSEPDTRMYRTGDLGRWATDGSIEFFRSQRSPGEAAGQSDRAGRDRGAAGTTGRSARGGGGLRAKTAPGEKRLVAYVVGEGGGQKPGEDAVAAGDEVLDQMQLVLDPATACARRA